MINSYIGYSTNLELRKKSTSGGIGSSIIKYLFEEKIIHTSITFDFNASLLQYTPRLIHNFNEYQPTGSIYHEIKLIQFIRDNINQILGGFACFVLPCQARPISALLKKNNIPHILIGLTCSSQQNINATKYLLRRLDIEPKDVTHIQYRGMGWPSGITIKLKNSKDVFVPNNNSIWTDIFHSKLFIEDRCFFCQNTLNKDSDISLADPWLPDIISKETIGQSLVMINTVQGQDIIEKMANNNSITIKPIAENLILKSQQFTIERKEVFHKKKKIIKKIRLLYKNKLYQSLILKFNCMFNIHLKIKNRIEKLLK